VAWAISIAWCQLPAAGGALDSKREPAFSSEEFLEPIKFLASEEMKGRGNGSEELNQAADYIARRFRAFGLRPGGEGRSFLQHFMMTVGAKLGTGNALAYKLNETPKRLVLQEDFIPLSFSENVELRSAVVFVGYGITAPEYHYDDYRGIDAKGKIVLVLRHEPQENDEKSIFAGKQLTTHAEIVNKAITLASPISFSTSEAWRAPTK